MASRKNNTKKIDIDTSEAVKNINSLAQEISALQSVISNVVQASANMITTTASIEQVKNLQKELSKVGDKRVVLNLDTSGDMKKQIDNILSSVPKNSIINVKLNDGSATTNLDTIASRIRTLSSSGYSVSLNSGDIALLGSRLDGVRDKIINVDEVSDGVDFGNANNSVGLLSAKLVALYATIKSMKAVVDKMFEGIEISDKTKLAEESLSNLFGSASDAQNMIDYINKMSSSTTTGREQLTDLAKAFAATGQSATKTKSIMEGLSNVAGMEGLSSDQISRASLALGQIASKGKLATEELNQLVEAGVNIKSDLVDKLASGSGSMFSKMLQNGQVDANTAITAIVDIMNTKFRGGADMASSTAIGAIQIIKNNAQNMLGNIMTDTASSLVEPLNEFKDKMSGLFDANPEMYKELTDTIADGFEFAVEQGIKLVDNIDEIAGVAVPAFKGIVEGAEEFGSAISNAIDMLASFVEQLGLAGDKQEAIELVTKRVTELLLVLPLLIGLFKTLKGITALTSFIGETKLATQLMASLTAGCAPLMASLTGVGTAAVGAILPFIGYVALAVAAVTILYQGLKQISKMVLVAFGYSADEAEEMTSWATQAKDKISGLFGGMFGDTEQLDTSGTQSSIDAVTNKAESASEKIDSLNEKIENNISKQQSLITSANAKFNALVQKNNLEEGTSDYLSAKLDLENTKLQANRQIYEDLSSEIANYGAEGESGHGKVLKLISDMQNKANELLETEKSINEEAAKTVSANISSALQNNTITAEQASGLLAKINSSNYSDDTKKSITKEVNSSLSSLLSDQEKAISSMKTKAVNSLKDIRNAQIDNMQSELNSIEKQRSASKKYYDEQINSIQKVYSEKKKEFSDKNDAEEILEIQKKIAMYKGSTTDAGQEQYKQALKELEKKNQEKELSGYQDQIDKLKELQSNTDNQYETTIDSRKEQIDNAKQSLTTAVNELESRYEGLLEKMQSGNSTYVDSFNKQIDLVTNASNEYGIALDGLPSKIDVATQGISQSLQDNLLTPVNGSIAEIEQLYNQIMSTIDETNAKIAETTDTSSDDESDTVDSDSTSQAVTASGEQITGAISGSDGVTENIKKTGIDTKTSIDSLSNTTSGLSGTITGTAVAICSSIQAETDEIKLLDTNVTLATGYIDLARVAVENASLGIGELKGLFEQGKTVLDSTVREISANVLAIKENSDKIVEILSTTDFGSGKPQVIVSNGTSDITSDLNELINNVYNTTN